MPHCSRPTSCSTPGCAGVATGITIAEVISSAWLRPDLARVYKLYEAGGSEEASSTLCRLMAEGAGVGYQLPDELPGDRTFAYSVAEVIYVERMGALLVGSA